MSVRTTSREFVNLLVELDERFSMTAILEASKKLHAQGYEAINVVEPSERWLSSIDLLFGGTWSGEVARGSAIFMTKRDTAPPLGLAAYGATGLNYYWLRSWQDRSDVGIVGPIGIAPNYRNDDLQTALVHIALAELRERGYAHALIPAVTEPIQGALLAATGGRVVERYSMDRIAPNIRTTVLASGGGTNFQAVIDALPDGLGLDLRALVVNRRDTFASERAKRAGIPVIEHVWDRAAISRERYDEELVALVDRTEPELVLMLGWMHLVSPQFVERFADIINIHPAFLPHDDRADVVTMPDGVTIPAFRGAHAIRDAIAAGSSWYGATAHRVVVETDRGQIMQRFPLPLPPTTRSEAQALAALRPTEHRVLLGAIRRYLAER